MAAETGSASRELLGKGAIYTFATIAPIVTGLMVTPLLTRILSPQDYGAVALGLTISQFSSILFGLGLGLAITRVAILGEHGSGDAAAIAVVGVIVAVMLGLTTLIATPVSGVLFEPSARQSLLLAIVMGVLLAGVTHVQAFARARQEAWRFTALAISVALMGPVAGLLACLCLGRSSVSYLTALAVVYGATLLFALWRIVRVAHWPTRLTVVAAFRVGLPMLPHALALQLFSGALVVLSASRLGVESAGLFQISMYISTAPLVLLGAINNAWVPLVLVAHKESRVQAVNVTIKDLVRWGSLLVLALAFASPVAAKYMLPSAVGFGQVLGLICFVSPVALLAVAYLGASHFAYVAGKTGIFAILTPISLGIGAAFGFLLSNLWGLVGIGFGFVAAYLVLSLGTSTWVAKRGFVAGLSVKPALIGYFLTALVSGCSLFIPVSGSWLWSRLAISAILIAALGRDLLATRRVIH